MSDDLLRGILARLEAIEASEGRIMERINAQHERLIESIDALRADFQATKGFLLEDAIVTGRRLLTIEERLSRLERGGEPR